VEEALGRNPRFLGRRDAHPADYYENALRRLRADGRWQGVAYNRRRDGTFYTAHMSLTVMRDDDGAISYYIGVLSDITARERAEQELLAWSRELDERVAARTAELSESREQLRKLAEHLETVKEEERKHIARDIHDELGQNLLALRIDISMLSARTGERHSRLRQRVDAALETVDGTIRSVRGIMNELRPPVLDLGLPAALEWQVAEFRKRSGLGCTLSLPAEASCAAIPPEMAIVLFRSLQEALSNVRRHAQATWVEVELVVEQERLTFSVADNGIGIAAASYCKSGSFGLIGMAQRVEALNGSFDIAQLPAGGGCRLTLGFDL